MDQGGKHYSQFQFHRSLFYPSTTFPPYFFNRIFLQNKLLRRLSYIFVGNEIHNSMVGRDIGNMGRSIKIEKSSVEKMLLESLSSSLKNWHLSFADLINWHLSFANLINVSQPQDQKSDESIWNRRVSLWKPQHRLSAPTGALVAMMRHYRPGEAIFSIFTQPINAIDVTRVNLSRFNSINAIDTREWH